ncbi:hypothetical protein VTK73DRAFT_5334 [Phialemonium thermophilum]|uniref:F-box domain-containing protein n=1 Tax=Phialemonium thermophilum TaxID=223376 RepID=A0ABR3Y7B7_9PEZI
MQDLPQGEIVPQSASLDESEEGTERDKNGLMITSSIRSRRAERLRKRKLQKQNASSRSASNRGLLELPCEILAEIFAHLRPSDLFRLSRSTKVLHRFICDPKIQDILAKDIISWRYPILSKCFRLPVPLRDVDDLLHPILQSEKRQELVAIHKKPYSHIKAPDPSRICTCLTCMLRWNSLCLIVDFAHWQPYLDDGEPIPMIPRGRNPQWNQQLVDTHAAVVERALIQPLWHARILEAHLSSTCRSIRRHALNKGNKRRRFRMTHEDEMSGADTFLGKSGPPTVDFPFHRDNYYMLETYLPNRAWNGEVSAWLYVPADQHDKDLQYLRRVSFCQEQASIPVVNAERNIPKAGGQRQQQIAEHGRLLA